MSKPGLLSLRKVLLWLLLGCCCLLVGACGSNTVNVYDQARVLDTQKVHQTASNLFKNTNIYTFHDFYGTQAEFYNAVVDKMRAGPNIILLVIDANHGSAYVLRGGSVNLSRADITQATNAFRQTYSKDGDYTQSTIAALNSLDTALNANHGFALLPILWIIPLLLIACAILVFLLLQARRRRRIALTR